MLDVHDSPDTFSWERVGGSGNKTSRSCDGTLYRDMSRKEKRLELQTAGEGINASQYSACLGQLYVYTYNVIKNSL